jgi:sugar/nucleoside kinase (ribokinase family)
MDKTKEVLVIGRVNVDYLSVLESYPEEDTKIVINESLVDIGGQGGNTSCCIARLGGTLKLIGRVGDDEGGRFCIERFKDCAIDTGTVQIIPGRHTPVSYIFITETTGSRTIMYEPENLPEIDITRQIRSYISESRVLLLDPSVTYLAKKLSLIKNRPPIVYDCERFRDDITVMMAVADYFVPSSEFLSDKILGLKANGIIDGIKSLEGLVANRLIVTDAGNGAYYIDNGSIYRIRPPEVRIVDTTGAGDNFHAALALAISRDFSFENAVKFSVTVATLSCGGYGGRIAVPGWDEAMSVSADLIAEKICPLE